ncbi:hypothetical protein [Roseovarius sp. 2305UL8-3]|uniref:hypothetical protein n=1 Tax=Roseovarius conchicola TaxID=3121636 RepID=UPI0035274424
MRITLTVLACAALAACSPAVPDSGVGFDDYDAYQARKTAREAALTGSALPPPNSVSSEPLGGTGAAAGNDAASIAADTRATLTDTQANSGQPVVYADPGNPAPQTVNTATGISSENDFDAVGNQRSIEDDAQLIAQNRSQYKVIQPTALPSRSGTGGPNIVEYALASKHPKGSKVYRRSGFSSQAKFQRNCAKYASADQAQIDFLSKGGPNRDRLGLDPDGDGYACTWDPAPFRNAVPGSGGA